MFFLVQDLVKIYVDQLACLGWYIGNHLETAASFLLDLAGRKMDSNGRVVEPGCLAVEMKPLRRIISSRMSKVVSERKAFICEKKGQDAQHGQQKLPTVERPADKPKVTEPARWSREPTASDPISSRLQEIFRMRQQSRKPDGSSLCVSSLFQKMAFDGESLLCHARAVAFPGSRILGVSSLACLVDDIREHFLPLVLYIVSWVRAQHRRIYRGGGGMSIQSMDHARAEVQKDLNKALCDIFDSLRIQPSKKARERHAMDRLLLSGEDTALFFVGQHDVQQNVLRILFNCADGCRVCPAEGGVEFLSLDPASRVTAIEVLFLAHFVFQFDNPCESRILFHPLNLHYINFTKYQETNSVKISYCIQAYQKALSPAGLPARDSAAPRSRRRKEKDPDFTSEYETDGCESDG